MVWQAGICTNFLYPWMIKGHMRRDLGRRQVLATRGTPQGLRIPAKIVLLIPEILGHLEKTKTTQGEE